MAARRGEFHPVGAHARTCSKTTKAATRGTQASHAVEGLLKPRGSYQRQHCLLSSGSPAAGLAGMLVVAGWPRALRWRLDEASILASILCLAPGAVASAGGRGCTGRGGRSRCGGRMDSVAWQHGWRWQGGAQNDAQSLRR